jgi:ankyrin repeat protein/acetyltransferase (GNAT) family protein
VIVMDRPVDLARARREAKLLLRAALAGDAAALARIGTPAPQLSDAQLAVARELGARSWPALVREAAARAAFEATLVRGDADAVSATLARDPSAAARPVGGREPLLHVAYSDAERAVECARLLLEAGADPNPAFEDGEGERMTALRGAARDPGMTALLIDAGADLDDAGALRAAAGAEDPACLELLLDAGAPLYRAMALAHAAQRGRVATALVLLERGPQQWGERENALVWAMRGEASPAMVRLLVEHGADLEASFDGTGRTPYGIAVRNGRHDLAELLATLGAQRRAEPLDELVGACMAGDRAAAQRLAAEHDEAARLLRTAEADVLVHAAARGRRHAVEILLDLGVPVDARGPAGATALAVTEDATIAALLTARGADPGKRAPVDEQRADEPPYAELEWAAAAAYLRHLATSPLAESRACGDGVAVFTGIDDNTENGVVCSRLDEGVDETIAWLRGAPAQWLVADDHLRERLVAAGANPERTAVVMGAELDRMAPAAAAHAGLAPTATGDQAAPADLTIAAVRDEMALADWIAVAGECVLDAPAEQLERRRALIASLGLSTDAPLQLRIARRDGRAVGVASFFVHGETVLGQHLGVLAPERLVGVGRALVQACARDARAADARFALIAPTPDTIAFYRLLGAVLRPGLRDRSFYLP